MNTTTANSSASTALARVLPDLDLADAAQLRSAFEAMFTQADEWVARAKEIRVTREDQKREMKLARESRLGLRELRINVEKTRKKLKEDSLRRGKAIDGLANVFKGLVEPIEEFLLEQETFADRAAEARRDALREARATALRALSVDPAKYADLGAMDESTWESLKIDAELAEAARKDEARKAEEIRIEAERIAAARREEERQAAVRVEAERVDRERKTAEENARLRAEAEERERIAAAERARLEQENAKVRADAEARELATRAERERAEAEATLAREELAAERARAAAEEQTKRAEQARKSAAPDREKIAAMAAAVRAIAVPEMATARGKQIADGIAARLQKLAAQIDEAVATVNAEAAE